MTEDVDAGANYNLDPRIGLAKKIARFGIIFSLILSLVAIGSLLSYSESDISSTTSGWSSEDSLNDGNSEISGQIDWAPAGFEVWRDDSNVAYKWADKSNCDNYGCVTAEFVSLTGCPNSFYAAINWLDSSDSVLSYDNATLPSLNPMQIAKLRFDDVEGNSDSGQMAEISCR